MRITIRSVRAGLLLLPVIGCTSWTRTAPIPNVTAGEAAEVWREGARIELRQVVGTPDSIAGIDASGARQSHPLDQVDSIRVKRADVGKTFLVLGGFVPAAVVFLFLIAGPEEI